ncbi:MAG TPA: hypothetical protein VEX88_09470 [Glaciibacter sp.]|nr:hypothetical protein [Glaciibacter sp.]
MADELYALAPGDFTAARNQRAKAAKAAGDKELAESIGRFPKPSVAAWVVNLLARQRPDVVAEVIELGDALRDAQVDSDRDRLKDLSRQRQDLLRAVAATGVRLAGESGLTVPLAAASEVEQTLQAAMADPDAANAVRTGRLTRTLASTGVEPVDLRDAVAGPFDESSAVARSPVTQRAATRKAATEKAAPRQPARDKAAPQRRPPMDKAFQRRLDEARERAEEAGQEVERARADLQSAEARARSLEPRREHLKSELADLRNRVGEVEREIAAVERELADAERDRAAADRGVATIERAAREARQRVERLSG